MRRIAAGLAAGLALAWASAASAQEVNLKYSNWLPANYFIVEKIMKPWIADVERVTEGRVTVDILPKVVGTVAGQYDVLSDGLADLSLWVPGYSPGRFQLMEGFDLPFLGSDPYDRSVAIWQTYEKFIADTPEHENIHVVSVFSSNSAHPVTKGKRMLTPAEFAGARLRTSSPASAQMVEIMGGTAVTKPFSELYEMAAGGIVDGATIPLDTIPGFKLNDVFDTVSLIRGGLTNSVLVVGMNKAKWDQISEADRKAIDEVSGEAMAKLSGQVHREGLESTMKMLHEGGTTFYESSEEEYAAIKTALRPIWDDWISRAKEKGLADPEGFLASMSAVTGDGY